MNPITWMTGALTVVSAFSAVPSALYGPIADATGEPWSTALLFSGHGLAAIVGMTIAGRVLSTAGRAATRIVVGALLLDIAGGTVLAIAMPASLPVMLVGRLVCGLALGLATTAASARIIHGRAGTAIITGAIFGGVGTGSIVAGVLIAAGTTPTGTLVVGLGALGVVCLGALTVRPGGTATPIASARRGAHAIGAVWIVWAAVAAFIANGVLALFTSTLAVAVAGLSGGASLVAGLTAGTTMLAAGAARLVLAPRRGREPVIIVAAALIGGLLLVVGFSVSGSAGAVTAIVAGTALGVAAGLTYDAALRVSAGRLSALTTVQRAGQAGLVVPPLVMTAVSVP